MLAELWSFMETGKWDIRNRKMRKDNKTESNNLIFTLKVQSVWNIPQSIAENTYSESTCQ